MSVDQYQAPSPAPADVRGPGMIGYCPWRHLGELPGVTLTWHTEGNLGETDFTTTTVSLRRDLDPRQLRVTLAHELVHIERGPGHGPDWTARSQIEEDIAELTAAMRLIPAGVLEDLPELVQRHGEAAACDFLSIDRGALQVALDAVWAHRTRRS